MFVPDDPSVRVCLTVVTLGTPPRLRACLDALRRHSSRHDFTLALLVNADTQDGAHALPDDPSSWSTDWPWTWRPPTS